MAGKIGGMAVFAFTGAIQSRASERSIAGCVVTGSTSVCRMNLTCANKRRGCGAVAADAIDRCWGERHIFRNVRRMIVIMASKVGGVAGGAGSAISAIDCGIAVAVCANDPGSVCAGVAGEAVIVVDSYHCVPGVAVYTQSSCCDSGCMIMTMGASEVICAMTADTL